MAVGFILSLFRLFFKEPGEGPIDPDTGEVSSGRYVSNE